MDEPDKAVPDVVFSPDLPADATRLLTNEPEVLIAAGHALPEGRSDLARKPGETVGCIVFGVAFLVGGWFFVRWALHAVLSDGLADWLTGGLGVFGLLIAAGMIFGAGSQSEAELAARKHHGQYLLAEDYDEEAGGLMLRAQEAVRAVVAAEVTKRGLLDEVKNHVVLPDLLWDIGQILREQSDLRARQAKTASGMSTPELEAVLGPQRQALSLSVAAIERKVGLLEQYAEQVRVADAALRAEEALKDGDRYVELLARSESSAQTELIGDLTDDAAVLRATLARSIADARETGRALAHQKGS